jgi:hypothetical protein
MPAKGTLFLVFLLFLSKFITNVLTTVKFIVSVDMLVVSSFPQFR